MAKVAKFRQIWSHWWRDPQVFFSRMCAAEILSLKKTEVPLNHFESAAEEGRRRQLCSGERKQERKSLELSHT